MYVQVAMTTACVPGNGNEVAMTTQMWSFCKSTTEKCEIIKSPDDCNHSNKSFIFLNQITIINYNKYYLTVHNSMI